MHSRLGLLDNQISINYNLSMPMLPPKAEDDPGLTLKSKKKNRKEKFALDNNFREMTQDELDKEIDYENNVDLDKTMWLVMRNKKSVNNILKKFETKGVKHKVQVNDIIKFGRVNFKVSIIKSDKLRKSIQGGYHLLEKKNKEIK